MRSRPRAGRALLKPVNIRHGILRKTIAGKC